MLKIDLVSKNGQNASFGTKPSTVLHPVDGRFYHVPDKTSPYYYIQSIDNDNKGLLMAQFQACFPCHS